MLVGCAVGTLVGIAVGAVVIAVGIAILLCMRAKKRGGGRNKNAKKSNGAPVGNSHTKLMRALLQPEAHVVHTASRADAVR